MKSGRPEKERERNFVGVNRLLEELGRDLPAEPAPLVERNTPPGKPSKEVILEVLTKAADDPGFLARLAENPAKVLQEYDLTPEERAALASGDLRKIERGIGKLDKRLSTWIWCRLQLEKW